MIDLSKIVDIKKLAAFHGLDRNEVISEAWLLQQEFPALDTPALMKKVQSRCIEITKTNGITSHGSCFELSEHDTGIESDHRLQAHSALDELIEREDAIALQNKIDALDTITQARLAVASSCRNGADLGQRIRRSKRSANEHLAAWISSARGETPPAAQQVLFA